MIHPVVSSGIISGVGMIIFGQSPLPASESIKEWATFGGAGILGFILFVILTRTIPTILSTHATSCEQLATAIKDSAKTQNETLINICTRSDEIQRENTKALLTITENCTRAQAERK